MEYNEVSVEFRSPRVRVLWSEEELEDLVCDIKCAVVQ
jgi:hypothetical protein